MLTTENIEKITKDVVAVAEKELDSSNLKRLNKLLGDNEKQRNNLFDSVKICDIDSVRKGLFEEISKMDQEHKEIEKQIIEEDSKYVKLTEKQVKYFLNQLKKGNADDEKYRRMLINVLVNKVYLYDDKMNITFNVGGKSLDISIKDLETRLIPHMARQLIK